MKVTIIYVGVDVDDTQYHGTAFNKATGEVIDFKCRPTMKGLDGQLKKVARHYPGCAIRVCYEASYVGYSLQRDLVGKGFHCDVVAPTSTCGCRINDYAASGSWTKPRQCDCHWKSSIFARGVMADSPATSAGVSPSREA